MKFYPAFSAEQRKKLYDGWQQVVASVINQDIIT